VDSAGHNTNGVWQQRVNTGAQAIQVAQGAAGAGEYTAPMSISADGKLLAVQALMPQGGFAAILHLDGKQRYERIVTTADAYQPSISPDGRFVAYVLGGDVYAQEIATGWRQVISAGPGMAPVWARSGEIFFWTGGDLKTVRVVSADRKQFDTPVTLFSRAGSVVSYDPTPDGKRFLVVVPDSKASIGLNYRISVVLNWFQELRAKVPAGGR
jgi:hypothetical protein